MALALKIAVIFLFFTSSSIFSQEKYKAYDIIYKGNTIGKMDLLQKRDGEKMSIKMKSDVEVSFIIKTAIKMDEESIYKDEKLIYSHTYRHVNGVVKSNKQTKAVNNIYHIIDGGKTEELKTNSINYNLALLYFKEPQNIPLVYSDTFQKYLKIENTAVHQYKIKLPNGNYNEYYYKDGSCYKVKVYSTLFDIEMILKS